MQGHHLPYCIRHGAGMSTNEDTFWISFRGEDGREQSGRYPPTSQQRFADENAIFADSLWPAGVHQNSYMPPAVASETNLPQTAASNDFLFSACEGDVWFGNQYLGEIGSFGDVPGADTHGPGTVSAPMEDVAFMPEQAFPVTERALPQCHPSSSTGWDQISQQSAPETWSHAPLSWQQIDYSSTTSYLEARSTQYTPTVPPVTTGNSGHALSSTGCLPPFVESPPFNGPVTSAICRPRGERWDNPNAKTFRCLWMSCGRQCKALIAGDRRSVTNHLRDKHGFSCDGRVIECAWDQCAECMQRRNISRHIVACHFAVKVPCPQCGMPLSRGDANKKHQRACKGVGKTAVGVSEQGAVISSGSSALDPTE